MSQIKHDTLKTTAAVLVLPLALAACGGGASSGGGSTTISGSTNQNKSYTQVETSSAQGFPSKIEPQPSQVSTPGSTGVSTGSTGTKNQGTSNQGANNQGTKPNVNANTAPNQGSTGTKQAAPTVTSPTSTPNQGVATNTNSGTQQATPTASNNTKPATDTSSSSLANQNPAQDGFASGDTPTRVEPSTTAPAGKSEADRAREDYQATVDHFSRYYTRSDLEGKNGVTNFQTGKSTSDHRASFNRVVTLNNALASTKNLITNKLALDAGSVIFKAPSTGLSIYLTKTANTNLFLFSNFYPVFSKTLEEYPNYERRNASFTGAGIKVAVVDGNLNLDDPNFRTRPVRGSYKGMPILSSEILDNSGEKATHGTDVALIIGGNQNSYVAGLAPNVQLVHYPIHKNPNYANLYRAILSYNEEHPDQRIHVVNNSYVINSDDAIGRLRPELQQLANRFNSNTAPLWVFATGNRARTRDAAGNLVTNASTSISDNAARSYTKFLTTTQGIEDNVLAVTGAIVKPTASELAAYREKLRAWEQNGSQGPKPQLVATPAYLQPEASAIQCGESKWSCLAALNYYYFNGTAAQASDRRVAFGTSFATPQVTATAALVKETFPFLTNPQLKTVLLTTATDIGEKGVDETFGWGLLNAEKALNGPGLFVGSDFVVDLSNHGANNYYFNNAIAGDRGLVVNGTSRDMNTRLFITRQSSYSGDTVVNGASLYAMRGLPKSNLYINSGGYAHLQDTDSTPSPFANVTNNGVLSVLGTSIKNLTLKPNSTLVLSTNRTTSVVDTAQLNGYLDLTFTANLRSGEHILLLRAEHLSGRFQGRIKRPSNSVFADYEVFYDYAGGRVLATVLRLPAAAGLASAEDDRKFVDTKYAAQTLEDYFNWYDYIYLPTDGSVDSKATTSTKPGLYDTAAVPSVGSPSFFNRATLSSLASAESTPAQADAAASVADSAAGSLAEKATENAPSSTTSLKPTQPVLNTSQASSLSATTLSADADPYANPEEVSALLAANDVTLAGTSDPAVPAQPTLAERVKAKADEFINANKSQALEIIERLSGSHVPNALQAASLATNRAQDQFTKDTLLKSGQASEVNGYVSYDGSLDNWKHEESLVEAKHKQHTVSAGAFTQLGRARFGLVATYGKSDWQQGKGLTAQPAQNAANVAGNQPNNQPNNQPSTNAAANATTQASASVDTSLVGARLAGAYTLVNNSQFGTQAAASLGYNRYSLNSSRKLPLSETAVATSALVAHDFNLALYAKQRFSLQPELELNLYAGLKYNHVSLADDKETIADPVYAPLAISYKDASFNSVKLNLGATASYAFNLASLASKISVGLDYDLAFNSKFAFKSEQRQALVSATLDQRNLTTFSLSYALMAAKNVELAVTGKYAISDSWSAKNVNASLTFGF